jgi:hypothetical protein
MEEPAMDLMLLTVPSCPNAAAFEERLAAALVGRPGVAVIRRQIADERAAAQAGMHGLPTLLTRLTAIRGDAPHCLEAEAQQDLGRRPRRAAGPGKSLGQDRERNPDATRVQERNSSMPRVAATTSSRPSMTSDCCALASAPAAAYASTAV